MTMYEVTYHNNGNIKQQIYRDVKGDLHRGDGPAYIYYYNNGNIKEETWWFHNKMHRIDGPAYVKYYRNGRIEIEDWRRHGNHFEREDGPVWIAWWPNGIIRTLRWFDDGDHCPVPDGKPSYVCYRQDGTLKSESWTLIDEDNRLLHLDYYNNGNVRKCTISTRNKPHHNQHCEDKACCWYYSKNGKLRKREYWIYGNNITATVKKLFGCVPDKLSKEQTILLKLSL